MDASVKDKLLIVGDIGGTNGRFAVAELTGDAPVIHERRSYQCADFASFAAMLDEFRTDTGRMKVAGARLAIAGPVTPKRGNMTNLDWLIDAAELESKLDLPDVRLLNDFAALARAAEALRGDQIVPVKPGNPDPMGPISVMGPGTGFGVAQLVRRPGETVIIPTEGGHMRFAPATKLEADLARELRNEMGYVSVETLLCGKGLARIHKFLVNYAGSGNAALNPAEITAAAIEGTAPSCERAVQVFLSILGSVAGDIALAHGATGGVFFGGGILPKIAPLLLKSDLVARFNAKGVMSPYVERLPIHLIVADDAALIGAALA